MKVTGVLGILLRARLEGRSFPSLPFSLCLRASRIWRPGGRYEKEGDKTKPINRYPEDEVVQRGQALYEQQIRAAVDTAENKGKMLVINIETGEWEMDADDVVAAQRAKVHFGDALLFSMRIGYSAAYRIGGGFLRSNP